ncbi:MAG TPA: hypothetical protein ENJ82_08295, partial [Bacteroidetes bacterium]|nr:hypothetical protein [Bacteroidota bacterium]
MTGLKVYLKSTTQSIYFFLQILAGLLLLTNALHFLESEHKLVLEVLLSGIGGGVILACLALPAHYRRRMRHLPGFLIFVAGAILFWNALVALEVLITSWYSIVYYVGICLMIIGLSSPIINPKLFIYISKNGIRFRNSPFPRHKLAWDEISRVEMGNRHLEIETLSGQHFRLKPEG